MLIEKHGPINTILSIQKQVTKTSLLIPYEQFYIQSHYYHKELIPEQKHMWKQPNVPVDLQP